MNDWRYGMAACAVCVLLATLPPASAFDDGAHLAFEDMLIDDAIEGELPAMDDDFAGFDELFDIPDEDPALPAEEMAPAAPTTDDDDIFDLLADWDESIDIPAGEQDWAGEFDATPAPAPEDGEDLLGQLGVEDAAEVVPPEATVAERIVAAPIPDTAIDLLADEPVFEDIAPVDVTAVVVAEPEPAALPDAAAEPDPVVVVERVPVPEPEPVAPATASVPDPEPAIAPPTESEPEPAPESDAAPAVVVMPPYSDPLALDDQILEALTRETRAGMTDAQYEGFENRISLEPAKARPTGWFRRLLGR